LYRRIIKAGTNSGVEREQLPIHWRPEKRRTAPVENPRRPHANNGNLLAQFQLKPLEPYTNNIKMLEVIHKRGCKRENIKTYENALKTCERSTQGCWQKGNMELTLVKTGSSATQRSWAHTHKKKTQTREKKKKIRDKTQKAHRKKSEKKKTIVTTELCMGTRRPGGGKKFKGATGKN